MNNCRFCGAELNNVFVDLGMSPIANDNVKKENLGKMEPFFPLCVYVCDKCYLAQLPEHQSPDAIFNSEYAYFSSFSDSWVKHAKDYVDKMIDRFAYNENNFVIELASNDGYLLQHFKAAGVPVLGIEPCANVAEAAEEKGIPSLVKFFGVNTAKELVAEGKKANLLLGNNVLAHVPDINDFVGGMKVVLNEGGVITMEFPHLMKLVEFNQFDTVYHEHYSYLSFVAVQRVFEHHGLRLFDVEEIPTHGGSLRIYACHKDDSGKSDSAAVAELLQRERDRGMEDLAYYRNYQEKVYDTKRKLLAFLIEAKNNGKSIVGYGAPAKGNTLLNYCGVRTDFVDFTVDRSPHKQGLHLPGTRIPILAPEQINASKPDYVLILPWNLKKEIIKQMQEVFTWGGKFVVPIPEVEVISK